MTEPQEKPPSAWSRLSDIWFAVNLGIPMIEVVILPAFRGDGRLPQILALVMLALLLISNALLAWLIGEGRIERSVAIFLGSMLLAGALIFAGVVVLFWSGTIRPLWG